MGWGDKIKNFLGINRDDEEYYDPYEEEQEVNQQPQEPIPQQRTQIIAESYTPSSDVPDEIPAFRVMQNKQWEPEPQAEISEGDPRNAFSFAPGGEAPDTEIVSQEPLQQPQETHQIELTQGNVVSSGFISWDDEQEPEVEQQQIQQQPEFEEEAEIEPQWGDEDEPEEPVITTANQQSNTQTHFGLPDEQQSFAANSMSAATGLGFALHDDHASRIGEFIPANGQNLSSFLKFNDGGHVGLHPHKITSDEVRPTDYQSAAAIMVAGAAEKGWDSIAINGHDQQLKDHVFVESFLQGIPMDKKSSNYKPGKNAKAMLQARADELGVDLGATGANRVWNGKIDYNKAFGISPYADRGNNLTNSNTRSQEPANSNTMFGTEMPPIEVPEFLQSRRNQTQTQVPAPPPPPQRRM